MPINTLDKKTLETVDDSNILTRRPRMSAAVGVEELTAIRKNSKQQINIIDNQ